MGRNSSSDNRQEDLELLVRVVGAQLFSNELHICYIIITAPRTLTFPFPSGVQLGAYSPEEISPTGFMMKMNELLDCFMQMQPREVV